MIDSATVGDEESQAFFLKMKADYYRYILTVAKENRLKEAREIAH